jgi:hypothetical protein
MGRHWPRFAAATALAAGLGVLLGTVGQAQDARTAAQLRLAQNNLQQIALAFHNHQEAFGALPNNVASKDGKPILSWRVQILPFIEEGKLYREFKLDEPWDSEHNKSLIARMPKLYAPVRGKAKEGETFYQVFTGEKAVFGPKQRPRLPASFPDGASNTLLVVEAGDPVVWTKPEDLVYDENKPVPRLGGMFDGVFHAALGDGSVIRCRKDPDEKELRKFIMPADGQTVDFNKLKQ